MGWEGFHRPPRFHPPLARAELQDAEARLGFELPAVVRQLYAEVANGGFGPGYGLLGLMGGARSDLGDDAVELYRRFRQPDPDDAEWGWPEALLPICGWGCAIHSCVDCRNDDAPVVRFDPNQVEGDWSIAFTAEGRSFEAWLEGWMRGEELFEAGMGSPG